MGWHFFLQGIFLTWDSNLCLLHWQADALPLSHQENPCVCMCARLVSQSCLTLCDPMDYSLAGSSLHGDSPGKNIGVGCHALLQGIISPTQGSVLAGEFFATEIPVKPSYREPRCPETGQSFNSKQTKVRSTPLSERGKKLLGQFRVTDIQKRILCFDLIMI